MQNDVLPECVLCSNLVYIHQCHSYNIRIKNKFKLPKFKKNLAQNNVLYSVQ